MRHAIPDLFKVNDICFYENCCKVDILLFTDIEKLPMYYDNGSLKYHLSFKTKSLIVTTFG
jgi:hypothetical protein